MYFMARTDSLASGKGLAIKGVLPFVPCRPSAILKLLTLPDTDPRKRRLNPDTDTSEVLARFDNRTLLKHQKNKGMWPTTAREIVMVSHIRKMPSGVVVVAVRNVDSPLAAPETPSKWVRMQVFAAGWVLEPVTNADGVEGTRATYVNHFDPMGDIPMWVVKKGSTINLSQVVTMKKLLSEFRKEFERVPPMCNDTFEIWPALATEPTTIAANETKDSMRENSKSAPDAVSVAAKSNDELPPNIAKAIEVGTRTVVSMANDDSYCSWSPYGSSGDVRYFMADDVGNGCIAIKGVLPYVPVDPAAIVTLLGLPLDDQRKKRLSPDVDFNRPLVRHNNHTVVRHQRNKAVWPTAPREMILAVHIRKMQDEKVLVLARSVASKRAPPEDSNSVRMHVEAAGWLLEPVVGDPRGPGTRATYVNQFNPMGGIPKWVVKKASTKNLSQVATLRDVIAEDVEVYQKIPSIVNETFEVCPELASTESKGATKVVDVADEAKPPSSPSSSSRPPALLVGSPPRSSFPSPHRIRHSRPMEVNNTCCGGFLGVQLGSPLARKEKAE